MWEKHIKGREIGLEIGRGGYDPARPSLLMVHGSGGRGASWLPQLSGLSGEINAAAVDLPGHGATPGPGRDSVDGYAAWLADFIQSGPIRPVVMGHSLGGAIALTLALERPQLLSGLILAGTGARLKVLPAILDGILNNFDSTVEMIIQFAYGDQPDPRLLAQGGEHLGQTSPEVLHGDFSACDKFDVSERLGGIKPPALVLAGDQDKLTPPKYAKFLADKIPGARLEIIAGGGHMMFIEQTRDFNRAVLEFMAAR
jgi:pimeloyl-ACP methyl ester carboxylesterase